MIVDTHAHLDMEEFAADRDQVIERARRADVGLILAVGTNLESSWAAVTLAEKYPEVYAAVGVHPHDAQEMGKGDLETLAQLCEHPKVVAIGEIGLDFYRSYSAREAQITVFEQQLSLGAERGLLVVVHCRNAHEEVLAMLERWATGPAAKLARPKGVMHCFSGTVAAAMEFMELGFLISLAGPVTYPNARRLLEVAQGIPLESLVVETDCPFLAPQPQRGHRNEPAFVSATINKIAAVRGTTSAVIANATTENALRLLRLATAKPPA